MALYSHYIFPKLFDTLMRHKIFDEHRARILKPLSGEVLEIGIGTGLNLPFYPSDVKHLFAVDPNPGMRQQLRKKLGAQKMQVSFSLVSAESLNFKDETFDFVVSTLTLCSIQNLSTALREIKRVLKPGGKFIFFEHGLSDELKLARWQHFLNPVQNIIGAGCSLNVDIASEIKKAGFEFSRLNRFYLKNSPRLSGCIFEGVAIKADTIG